MGHPVAFATATARFSIGCLGALRRMRAIILVVVYVVAGAAAWAQEKPVEQPRGATTVSGHVFCADTNAPARMANVMLQPVELVDSMAAGEKKIVASHGEAVQTLLDGSFSIAHVAPGTYYVIALQMGYVSPLASMYLRAREAPTVKDEDSKKATKAAPRITVEPDLPVVVNVTIERGAAVSGTVLYDDGSPASGVRLTLLIRQKGEWANIPVSPLDSSSFRGTTDDVGHYRISGLPAGEYLLETSLNLMKVTYRMDEHGATSMSMTSGDSLEVYPGGSTRRKDGTPLTLMGGEEQSGRDVEIPLSKLHTVRGKIEAARDGHEVNGGSLTLLHADDKSQAGHAEINKDDDSFLFGFVAEGDYILHADGAEDNDYREVPNKEGTWPPTRTEIHTLRRYGSADLPVHVAGELMGVLVRVPDASGP